MHLSEKMQMKPVLHDTKTKSCSKAEHDKKSTSNRLSGKALKDSMYIMDLSLSPEYLRFLSHQGTTKDSEVSCPK